MSCCAFKRYRSSRSAHSLLRLHAEWLLCPERKGAVCGTVTLLCRRRLPNVPIRDQGGASGAAGVPRRALRCRARPARSPWRLATTNSRITQSPGRRRSAYDARVRRSPQEDKALSYAKDRRYAYGNNAHAARKAVPRRKRWVNKANRHAEQQFLTEALGTVDVGRAEAVEERLRGRWSKRWRKSPDRPLGQVLERRRQRQAAS